MSKLEKMLVKVKNTTSTISSHYYGYVYGRRCNNEYKKLLRGHIYILPSPSSDIEIVFVRQESRMDTSVWMEETEDSLRQCLHDKSSGTSWVSAGSYIVILKGEELFFSSIGGMRKWTVNEITFKEDVAIISGEYEAPDMSGLWAGFQPGDMGYYKKEYELEIPKVEKIPL